LKEDAGVCGGRGQLWDLNRFSFGIKSLQVDFSPFQKARHHSNITAVAPNAQG
jgi:hypothetical protein